jgi:Domain of unknown function (DUF2019).
MSDIKQEFILQRLNVEEASLSGDYRKNNRAMKTLQQIYKVFEDDIKTADMILQELLKHENSCVKLGAATHCIALGIHIKQSKSILNNIARTSENRVIAFNAQATLDVLEKQGYLRVYPKTK